MSSFNKVIVMGNLTRDPEVKQLSSGSQVCDLSLACNRVWNKDGQKQEEVSYFDCTLWGKTAEIAGRYLSKGMSALIEGRLQQDRWDDKESGQKRSKIKIIGEKLTLLPRAGSDSVGTTAQPAMSGSEARPQWKNEAPSEAASQTNFEEPSDIPF